MIPDDQPYYDWLASQIEVPRSFGKDFHELFAHLHNYEFVWIVPGDDNRVQDGKDLRNEFMHKFDIPNDFPELGFKHYVSILEVVIAISKILEFIAGGEAPAWAWRLLDNLKLNHFYDPLTDKQRAKIDEMLETLIWRTYERDGQGGFFPLIFPAEDQTKVEIWYQLNSYVKEIIQV